MNAAVLENDYKMDSEEQISEEGPKHVGARVASRGITIPGRSEPQKRAELVQYLFDPLITNTILSKDPSANTTALCYFTSLIDISGQSAIAAAAAKGEEQGGENGNGNESDDVNPNANPNPIASYRGYLKDQLPKLSEVQGQIASKPFEYEDLSEYRTSDPNFQDKGVSFLGGCPPHLTQHSIQNLCLLNPEYPLNRDLYPIPTGRWLTLKLDHQPEPDIHVIFERCMTHRLNVLCKHREVFERRAKLAQFLSSNQAIEVLQGSFRDCCEQTTKLEIDFQVLYWAFRALFSPGSNWSLSSHADEFEQNLESYYTNLISNPCGSQFNPEQQQAIALYVPEAIKFLEGSHVVNIPQNFQFDKELKKSTLTSNLKAHYSAWEAQQNRVVNIFQELVQSIQQVDQQATADEIKINVKPDQSIAPTQFRSNYKEVPLKPLEMTENFDSSFLHSDVHKMESSSLIVTRELVGVKKRRIDASSSSSEANEPQKIMYTPIATNVSNITLTSHAILAFLEDPLPKAQGGVEGIFSVLSTGSFEYCEKMSKDLLTRFKNMIPLYIVKSGTFHQLPLKQACSHNILRNPEREKEMDELKKKQNSNYQ